MADKTERARQIRSNRVRAHENEVLVGKKGSNWLVQAALGVRTSSTTAGGF